MAKPRILISGTQGSLLNYENAVRISGGEPFPHYLPPVDGSFDALLLTGGDDIHPRRFGQENTGSQGIDEARDEVELALVALYVAQKKPILGICRGHQLLNVAFGGTLIQDMAPHLLPFHRNETAAKDPIHPVSICEGSILYSLYGSIAMVNTYHHQVVDVPGAGLTVTARSEGGLVEALEHESLPILGVQFHPERIGFARQRPDADDGSFIFQWFFDTIRQQQSGRV